MKKIVKILIFILITIAGCQDKLMDPSYPEPIISNPSPNLNLQIFGKSNINRTYFQTVSKINLLTNEPVIIPPDSIRNRINFPDSLYNIGVFVYVTISEKNEIIGDTLKIYQKEFGCNLFNIINSFPSEGFYSSYSTWEYFADSNKIYVGKKPFIKILFEVPLMIDSIYATPYDTIKIVGREQITVGAGSFYAYKIKRDRVINEELKYSSLQFIVPEIGVVLFEESYISNEIDEITGQNVIIEQYGKSELIRYE